MAISYDTLELGISANVDNAVKGIKDLKNSLNSLQKSIKGLDVSLLANIEKHLQKIAKIDFSNVSKGLQDIVSAFKYMESLTTMKKDFTSVNFSMDATPVDTLGNSGRKEPSFKRPVFSTEYLNNLQTGIVYLTSMDNVLTTFSQQGNKVIAMLKKFGTTIGTAMLNRLKKFNDGLLLTISRFKRILFYRVVRRVIQLIAQALKEGIQNIAMFDSDFNQTMSNIKSSISYLKNSLGSMIAPLVEMLEPFIVMLLDGLSEVANLIGETFAKMTGNDYFVKAKKNAEDYTKSLEKAKNVSLGIDELHVAEKTTNDNFEKVDIAPNEVNKDMVEATNSLFETIKKIGTALSPIVSAIMKVVEILLPPLTHLVDVILQIVEMIIASVGDNLAELLPPIAETIGHIVELVASIIELILPIVQILIDIFQPYFDILVDTIVSVLGYLNGILGFVNSIVDLFKRLDEIIAPIREAFFKIRSTIFDMSGGLNGVVNFANILKGVFDKIKWAIDWIADKLHKVADFTKQLTGSVNDFTNRIQGQSGNLSNRWADGYQFGDVVGSAGDLAKTVWSKITGWLGFATGGFPEDGFFFANHNELVGQFSNGKTAVANNEQITTGIYQAVLQAMQDSGAVGGNREIVVQIDGREVGRASEKYTAQKGDKSVFTGGYHYGY